MEDPQYVGCVPTFPPVRVEPDHGRYPRLFLAVSAIRCTTSPLFGPTTTIFARCYVTNNGEFLKLKIKQIFDQLLAIGASIWSKSYKTRRAKLAASLLRCQRGMPSLLHSVTTLGPRQILIWLSLIMISCSDLLRNTAPTVPVGLEIMM